MSGEKEPFFEDIKPSEKTAWGDVMEENIENEEVIDQRKEQTKKMVSVWNQNKDVQKEYIREPIATAELPKAIPSLLSADLGFLDDRPPPKKQRDEIDSYRRRRDDPAGWSRNSRGRGKSEYYRSGPGGKGHSKVNPRQGRDDCLMQAKPAAERNWNSENESKRNAAEKDAERDRCHPWVSTQKSEKSNQSLIWQNSDSMEASNKGSFGIWHNSNLDAKEKASQNVWQNKKIDLPSNGKQGHWSGHDAKQSKENKAVGTNWSDATPNSFADTTASSVLDPPKATMLKDRMEQQSAPEMKLRSSSSSDVRAELKPREWQNSSVEQLSTEEPVNVWLKRSAEMQRKSAEELNSHNVNVQDEHHGKELSRCSSQHQEVPGIGRQDSRDSASGRRNRDYEHRKMDSQSRRQARDGASTWTQQRPQNSSHYDRDNTWWSRSSEPPGSVAEGGSGVSRRSHFSRDDLTDFVIQRDDTELGRRYPLRDVSRSGEGNEEKATDGHSRNNERKRMADLGSNRQSGSKMRNEYRSSRRSNRNRREPHFGQEVSDMIQESEGAWSEKCNAGNVEMFSNSERQYHRERNGGERRRHGDTRNPPSLFSSRGEPRGRGRGVFSTFGCFELF